MIPKVIHWCWFSGERMSVKLRKCEKSWRQVLKDYSFKCWTLENIPQNVPYLNKAIADKKWAFASDYIRLWALNNEGGIYLDTDIFMVKPFDELLLYNSFWGRADYGLVEPVVIGSVPNNNLLKECLAIYNGIDLSKHEYKAMPEVIQQIFIDKGFNLIEGEKHVIDGNAVLPYTAFCPLPFLKSDESNFKKYIINDTFCVHLWDSSWYDPFRFFSQDKYKSGFRAVFRILKKPPLQPYLFYKSVGYYTLKYIRKLILKQKS